MIKVYEDAKDFKDYSSPSRNAGDCASIWVRKSVFVGMNQDKFVGKFKIKDLILGGSNRRCSARLELCAKKLPCKIKINMQPCRRGQKASAFVTLIDWGKIDDDYLGIVICGIAQ